jgi:ACS family glucarate transporter-like MFS transporter
MGWMFLFWFPDYLVDGRSFSLEVMGVLGVAVHGAGFVGILSGGAISDRLLRTGWSPQFARVRFPGMAVALSVPFLVVAPLVSSPALSVVSLLLFYLLFASAIAGYTTVALEFNPHMAGSIFGMINTLGSFAGIFGPMTAGFMLSQSGGNWALPFFAAAAAGTVCASILFVVPIRPIKVETFIPTDALVREVAH